MIILLLLHILSAVFWVGGMLFAHSILRPAAYDLEPSIRLPLWRRAFARFFPAVWVAIVLLLVSGYGMVLTGLGGFAHIVLYVNIMQGIGIIMMLIFAHLFFAPWKRFKRAVDAQDFPAAAKQLEQIRMIVTVNLALGLIVVVVGATGRYWGA